MTLAEELELQIPAGTRIAFGQLFLSCIDDGTYEARHCDDADADAGLKSIGTIRELREMAKYDDSGVYRPLKTAPGLKSGWKTETSSPDDFLTRIDAIYPGLFATWVAYRKGELEPVAFRQTLDRQTGMYRLAGTITDEMADSILNGLCGPGCLRRITWPIGATDAAIGLQITPDSIPLLCTEACTFAVSKARELSKEAYLLAKSLAEKETEK